MTRNPRYAADVFLRERYYSLRSSINQISELSGGFMTGPQNSASAESAPSGVVSSQDYSGAGPKKPGAPLSGEK